MKISLITPKSDYNLCDLCNQLLSLLEIGFLALVANTADLVSEFLKVLALR